MKYAFFLIFLSSCATLPDLYKTVDDIATDNAITVLCDRDCFQGRNTHIVLKLDVQSSE